MIRSYLTMVWRNLRRQKGISFINIAGLAVGIAAFLIIIQYVRFERSYDNFHEHGAAIYRVESRFFKNGTLTDDWPTSSGGYGPAMQREFPAIKSFARVYLWGNERIVSVEDIKHREKNVFLADASFLQMFSFDLVKGDAQTALREPNTVVLSESAARKYFGYADPIGKPIKLSNTESIFECAVTGVFKDVPPNSHLQFDILISFKTLSSRWPGVDEFWYQHEAYTYVMLEPGISTKTIEEAFPALAEKHKTMEALKDLTWSIALVPLREIHLNPLKSYEREVKGSKTVVWVLTGIAILILFIAWINYINLSTARSLERAREIGVRKTSGARKEMLVYQFLFESAIINLLSLLLSLLLVWLSVPYFSKLTGINFAGTLKPDLNLCLMLSGIFVAGTLISGIYPALVLSSFDPVTALKGKITQRGIGGILRKCLVVFQFAVSMVLITVSIVIFQQVRYMRTFDLGMETNQILVLKTPATTDDYELRLEGFRNELLRLPDVINSTISSAVPGKEVAMFLSNRRADENTHEHRLYEMLRTDYDFLESYKLQLLHGRNFSRDFPSDQFAVIINEESVKQLGYPDNESAIGKEVYLEAHDHKFTIIGVLKNFHQTSLKNSFTPIMLFISPDYSWIPFGFISLKVESSDWQKTLGSIQDQWTKIYPESSFDYFFLNDFIDQQYKMDLAFGKLVTMFCWLTIAIACLGLFGLVSYDTLLRRKEVGIRKILGASTSQLLLLLSRDMLKLLVLAYVVGLPVAYLTISAWLEHYSFRTDLSVWMFGLPLIILLPVAFLTMSTQTLKVTLHNPIDSVRSE